MERNFLKQERFLKQLYFNVLDVKVIQEDNRTNSIVYDVDVTNCPTSLNYSDRFKLSIKIPLDYTFFPDAMPSILDISTLAFRDQACDYLEDLLHLIHNNLTLHLTSNNQRLRFLAEELYRNLQTLDLI